MGFNLHLDSFELQCNAGLASTEVTRKLWFSAILDENTSN